jgi:hypothetical protein
MCTEKRGVRTINDRMDIRRSVLVVAWIGSAGKFRQKNSKTGLTASSDSLGCWTLSSQ